MVVIVKSSQDMRPSNYEIHNGCYDLSLIKVQSLRTQYRSVKDLKEDSKSLIGLFVWLLERKVLLVVMLQMLILINIPHIHVPVGPVTESDGMQLKLQGLHYFIFHHKYLIFVISAICSQCKVIYSRNVYLLNLTSQKHRRNTYQLQFILWNLVIRVKKISVYKVYADV